MGFVEDVLRTLRATKRPDSKTFRASMRVVGLGIIILGSIGYIFQLAGSALRMVSLSPPSTDVLVIVIAALVALVLGVALYVRRKTL